MPNDKSKQQVEEHRSMSAALAQGAAGGAAYAVVQQGLAKLGSLGKKKK